MAKNALIVGPPRSGTSLASSILARVGYHVGRIENPRDRLGDDHNPFGYFEADDIVERNADVLRRAGHPFHNTWTSEPITPGSVERIRDLSIRDDDSKLVRAYGRHAPWLWKDPRLCFTLPYWWEVLDHESTVVYLTTRDERHAHSSFLRKGWAEPGSLEKRRVTRLVRQHARAAREVVDSLGLPHVRIDYSEYSRDPEAVADKLSTALETTISPDDLNFRPELDHSDLCGRISGHIRSQLRRLPREPVERLASMVPTSLMALLFPERKHVRRTRRDAADPYPHDRQGALR